MSQLTTPPHFTVRGGRHVCRLQSIVFLTIPLGGNSREIAGQVVLSGKHCLARAVGAAYSADTGGNHRLPLMAFSALPPNLAVGACQHIGGHQTAVFGGVPLTGQFRPNAGQVVDAGQQCPVGTDRTAAARNTGFHHGPPFVFLFADPPHCPVAPNGNTVRGKGTILLRVPLGGNIGPLGCQIVFSRTGPLPDAVGALCSRSCPGVNGGFPFVAPFTSPPNFLAAAIGDAMRSQRIVIQGMPLLEQGELVMLHAVVIQGCFQKSSPRFTAVSVGYSLSSGLCCPA